MEIENSDTWEKIFASQDWGHYPDPTLIRFVARNYYKAPDRRNVRILELGCGPGANIWYLVREGFSAYGIDFSKVACGQLIKRLEKDNLRSGLVELKFGDYEAVLGEFPQQYFDAVVDVESLYCNSYTKTKRIVKSVQEVLKPGGRFFSTTFAVGCWGFEGKEIDFHAVLPTEGPMKGKGFSRYSTEQDIADLYSNERLKIENLERSERHLTNKKIISEWIVEAINS